MQQHSSQSFAIPNTSIPFEQFLEKILLVLAPFPTLEDTQTWILPNIHTNSPTTTQLPFFRVPVTTRAPNTTPHHFTDDAFRQKFKDTIDKIRKNGQSNAIKNNINLPAFISEDLAPESLQSEKIE